jgi:hypothetical protein
MDKRKETLSSARIVIDIEIERIEVTYSVHKDNEKCNSKAWFEPQYKIIDKNGRVYAGSEIEGFLPGV